MLCFLLFPLTLLLPRHSLVEGGPGNQGEQGEEAQPRLPPRPIPCCKCFVLTHLTFTTNQGGCSDPILQVRRLRLGALKDLAPQLASRKCPGSLASGSLCTEAQPSRLPPPCRPLIKLHIIWKKDGELVSGGISDYNRRLTIPNPAVSDAGYYECEAMLRSSSVAPVARGAYLSVLGEMGQGRWGWVGGGRGQAA
jgi:hypothetical protein